MTSPPRLDSLPIEIIHRIVTAGTCRIALCLAAVNQRLHSICYEPLLFEELVGTRVERTLSKSADWWERAVGSDRQNTNLAARWALADELAAEVVGRPWESPMNMRTLEWIVPLLTVGHPSGRNLPCKYLGPGGYCFDPRTEGIATAAFFFAYQMSLPSSSQALKHRFEDELLTLSEHAILAEQLLGAFSDNQSPLASPVVIDESRLRRSPRVLMDEGSIRIHAQVMIGLGILAPLVRNSLRDAHAPPEACDVPLASLVRSPPPFFDLSDMAFTSQYVGSMVKSSFLEDGEWMGFYCHSMGLSDDMRPMVDPAMTGIHFEAVGETPGGALLVTSSNGQDSVGNFNLWESISADSGLLMMFKSYQGGHPRWLWQGALTPYGMAGTWGDESYGGWFWLWKRAWSTGSTSQP